MKKMFKKLIVLGITLVSISFNSINAFAFVDTTVVGGGKWIKGAGENEWYWSRTISDYNQGKPSNVNSGIYLINGVQYGFDENGKMVNGKVIWNADRTEATINGVVYDKIEQTKLSHSDYNWFYEGPENYYQFHVKGTPDSFRDGGIYREFLVDPNTNEILIGKQVNPLDGKTYLTNYKGELLSGFQLNPFTRRWEFYNRNSGVLETGTINLNGKTYNLDDPHLNEFHYYDSVSARIDKNYSNENDRGYYFEDYLLERDESEKQLFTSDGLTENVMLKMNEKYFIFNY